MSNPKSPDWTKRLAVIAILGGACERCGFAYPRALEFAHKVPVKRKHFGKEWCYQSGSNWSRQLYKMGRRARKVARCLCASCHRIETWERGEWSSGNRKRKDESE